MGCLCSGTDSIHIQPNQNIPIQQSQNNPYVQSQAISQVPNNIQYQNRQNNVVRVNQRSQPVENPQQQRNQAVENIPNYEPYLQSRRDPNFNFTEIEEYVGEGLKKMKGYICKIEKEDLIKKRSDFWTSRFEGNPDTWELLQNFCLGEFSNEDLYELLVGSGLQPYAGCLNVIYDAKGNIYEIPNYCIHEPSQWDIQKLKVIKPKEEKIPLLIKNGVKDFNISTSNLNTGYDIKEGIVNSFKIDDCEVKTINPARVRLFFRGKEIKDKDFLYQHELFPNSILMMMVKQEN